MKLVLDTNVLVAALIARGQCADLLEHCILRHSVISSQFILDELDETLKRKFHYTADESYEAVDLIRSQMQVVLPDKFDPSRCRDPDDAWILGTAIGGDARCIVTGDKDLLVLQRFEGIDILRPGDFIDYELNNSGESQ